MEEQLIDLILKLKELAPAAWRILERQVMVAAYRNLGWSAFSFAATLGLVMLARVMFKRDSTDETGLSFWIGVLATLTCLCMLVIALCLLDAGLARLMNPRYYAIELIVKIK